MSICRLPQVKAKTGHRSNASIYTAIRDGLFPRPVKIGERSVGWPEYEVDALVNARIAGQDNGQIKALVTTLHNERAGVARQLSAVQP